MHINAIANNSSPFTICPQYDPQTRYNRLHSIPNHQVNIDLPRHEVSAVDRRRNKRVFILPTYTNSRLEDPVCFDSKNDEIIKDQIDNLRRNISMVISDESFRCSHIKLNSVSTKTSLDDLAEDEEFGRKKLKGKIQYQSSSIPQFPLVDFHTGLRKLRGGVLVWK